MAFVSRLHKSATSHYYYCATACLVLIEYAIIFPGVAGLLCRSFSSVSGSVLHLGLVFPYFRPTLLDWVRALRHDHYNDIRGTRPRLAPRYPPLSPCLTIIHSTQIISPILLICHELFLLRPCTTSAIVLVLGGKCTSCLRSATDVRSRSTCGPETLRVDRLLKCNDCAR